MESPILTGPLASQPHKARRRNRIPRSVSQPSSTQHTDVDSALPQLAPKKQARKKKAHQPQPQPHSHSVEASDQAEMGAITPPRAHFAHHASMPNIHPKTTSGQVSRSQRGHDRHATTSNSLSTPNYRSSRSELIQPNTSTPAKSKSQAYAGPTFHASPAPSALPIPRLFARSTPDVDKISQPLVEAELSSSPSSNGGDNSPTMAAALRASDQKIREASPLDMFFNADRAERARQELGVLSRGTIRDTTRDITRSVTRGATQDGDSQRSASISPLPQYSCHHERHLTVEPMAGDAAAGLFPLEMDASDASTAKTRPLMPWTHGEGQRSESSPSVLSNHTSREAIAKQKTIALKQFLLSVQSQSSNTHTSMPTSMPTTIPTSMPTSMPTSSTPRSSTHIPTPGLFRHADLEGYKSSPSPSPFSKQFTPSPSPSTPSTSTGYGATFNSATSPYWGTPTYRNMSAIATRPSGQAVSSQLRQQVSPESTDENLEPSTGSSNPNFSRRTQANLPRDGSTPHQSLPRARSTRSPTKDLSSSLQDRPTAHKSTINNVMEEQLRQILRLEPITNETSTNAG